MAIGPVGVRRTIFLGPFSSRTAPPAVGAAAGRAVIIEKNNRTRAETVDMVLYRDRI